MVLTIDVNFIQVVLLQQEYNIQFVQNEKTIKDMKFHRMKVFWLIWASIKSLYPPYGKKICQKITYFLITKCW